MTELHHRQVADLQILAGARLVAISIGEVGPELTLVKDGVTVCLEAWRDEEGNGPGVLVVTGVRDDG